MIKLTYNSIDVSQNGTQVAPIVGTVQLSSAPEATTAPIVIGLTTTIYDYSNVTLTSAPPGSGDEFTSIHWEFSVSPSGPWTSPLTLASTLYNTSTSIFARVRAADTLASGNYTATSLNLTYTESPHVGG